MKSSSMVSGSMAFIVMTALTAAPLLAAPGGGMTTGDLALQLTRAAGITLAPADSPRAALDSLARAGITLGTDPGVPVTGKMLVQVGAALGVNVTTSRPDATVTSAMSSAFIALFKGEIQSAAGVPAGGGSEAIHVSCQGRDSRAGRDGTPASPSNPNATAEPCEDPAPRP